jgi:hypothetical protein
MSDLKLTEKRPFEILFGMNTGYVMDFTNYTFESFFSEYGIEIYSEKYAVFGDSKAKRLRAFWQVESNETVGNILSALIDYKRQITPIATEGDLLLLNQCKVVIKRLRAKQTLRPSLESMKDFAVVFNAEYLTNQIRRLELATESDPALAIGTAKELVETCCHTILNERSISSQGIRDMPALVRVTLKELQLVPNDVSDYAKGIEVVKRLVSNLASVSQGLAELRNLYGTGHGKEGKTHSISSRHAKLAVGAASTLAMFLFETHKEMERIA